MGDLPNYERLNNDRLPSYSSITRDDVEININIDNYKLNKNIKNIKLYGYVGFIVNSIYLLFSIVNSNDVFSGEQNKTNIIINDEPNEIEKIYNNLLYIYYILFVCTHFIIYFIYYNLEFSYLLENNKKKYKFIKLSFTTVYFLKYIFLSLFIMVFINSYEYLISSTNIYIFQVICINYFINEFIDKIAQISKRDLLLIE